MLVFAHVSSMNTTLAGSIDSCAARHATRCSTTSGRSCSLAISVFFSRLLQRMAGGANRSQANLFAKFPLQVGLQLTQINVGLRCNLRDQPVGPGMPLGSTRGRLLGRDPPRLATLLLNASQPRIRDVETKRDRTPLFVRIASGQHLAAKRRIVRFHQDHLLEMNPTYRSSLGRARPSVKPH